MVVRNTGFELSGGEDEMVSKVQPCWAVSIEGSAILITMAVVLIVI